MYADDHQLYETGDDLVTVTLALSSSAEKASKWYEDNMLKGNYSKYKTMLMQNDKEMASLSMNIQGNEIESTDKLNLLGVTIDYKLSFSDHTVLTAYARKQVKGLQS